MDSNADTNLYARVREDIDDVLERYLPQNTYLALGLSSEEFLSIRQTIYGAVFEDLTAFAHRDEAAHRDSSRVYERPNFKAVRDYRIANTLYYCATIDDQELREKFALRITETAKRTWGIEIHAAAEIGSRFVLDHGHATVIGEMCKIGSDCYFLQNVILGATEVGGPVAGRRHPTIGNRVSICAQARIFGPVTVGDDAFIGPHCVITTPIPPGCRVRIVNQLQLTRNRSGDAPPEIDGLVCADCAGPLLELHGNNLDTIDAIELVAEDLSPIPDVRINFEKENHKLTFHICAECALLQSLAAGSDIRLLVRHSNYSDYILIKHATALKRALKRSNPA
jgi:serine O-acetyltransferase